MLEPYDRIAEILFGLIMVLTFTGSLSIAEAGGDDVRTMLIGALGCNLAWGVIDGILYLLGCMAEQGRLWRSWRAVRAAATPDAAQRVIANNLPPVIATLLEPAEYARLHQRILQLPEPAARPGLRRDDWLGAIAVFLLVTLSTFPVVIPFLLTPNARLALRISNAVAIAMLFFTGAAFGRTTERSPWRMGLVMVALGGMLVGLTMALGG